MGSSILGSPTVSKERIDTVILDMVDEGLWRRTGRVAEEEHHVICIEVEIDGEAQLFEMPITFNGFKDKFKLLRVLMDGIPLWTTN